MTLAGLQLAATCAMLTSGAWQCAVAARRWTRYEPALVIASDVLVGVGTLPLAIGFASTSFPVEFAGFGLVYAGLFARLLHQRRENAPRLHR